MSTTDESSQVMPTTALGSSGCGTRTNVSTNEDCATAITPTNFSTVSENADGEAASLTLNDPRQLDDQQKVNAFDETMVRETQPVSAKETEGKERQQDCEQTQTTQKKDCVEEEREDATALNGEKEKLDSQTSPSINEEEGGCDSEKDIKHTIIVTDRKGTNPDDLEAQKPEANDEDANENALRHSESNTTTQQKEDENIEWLSPYSMPRVKKNKEDNNAEDDGDNEGDGKDGALKMLKKGAVAAVGGTMVGVGLVMIPLPTPFGAVVASSGLAVLGTEFNDAKELNDKLIDGAKGHLNKARDSIVKGIENMHSSDDDSSIDSKEEVHFDDDDSGTADKERAGGAGTVIKVNAATAFVNTNSGNSIENEDCENSDSDNALEKPPVWLHMNPIERERQAKLAKKKYKRDKQTSYEQAKDAFTKKTGKFLSDNILPLLKKPEQSAAENEKDVTDGSITSGKSKHSSKFLSGNMMSYLQKQTPLPDKSKSAESDASIMAPKTDKHENDTPSRKKLSSQSMMSFLKMKPSLSDETHSPEISPLLAVSNSDGTESDTSVTRKKLSAHSMISFLKMKPTTSDKSETSEMDISKSASDGTDGENSVAKKMLNSMSFLKKKPGTPLKSRTEVETTSKCDETNNETSVTKNMLSSQTMMSFLQKKPHSTTATKSVATDKGESSQTMMSFLKKKPHFMTASKGESLQTMTSLLTKKPLNTSKSESTVTDAQNITVSKIDVDDTDISVTKNGGT
eukprot:CAMPEP_0197189166 /NCGR_PEP_ID=MMETSP1423-20130617/19275_1 /TAXON_ID=476441 /ORGANISM="Pseudo-nitzschia heimii, Strain UNC1101" /LENGTH=742 /DNA_ID=CAMNT_0042641211 /DNA_START=27 /DNA_END=2255 /DNA_ORIENTATION=+